MNGNIDRKRSWHVCGEAMEAWRNIHFICSTGKSRSPAHPAYASNPEAVPSKKYLTPFGTEPDGKILQKKKT